MLLKKQGITKKKNPQKTSMLEWQEPWTWNYRRLGSRFSILAMSQSLSFLISKMKIKVLFPLSHP